LPYAKADVVLDTVPTPVEIDRALARLEMKARDTGFAVGFATAQPATIARVADWAKKWKGAGFSWCQLLWWRSKRSRRNVIQVARVRGRVTEYQCLPTNRCPIAPAPA
jgi:polysaccharide deacetylase 2 family uncharacterized protein YibQ